MKSFSEFKDTSTDKKTTPPDKNVWMIWKSLVNMTAKDIKEFYASKHGRTAGTKKKDGNRIGVDHNGENIAILLQMIPIGDTFENAEHNWTSDMWKFCNVCKDTIEMKRRMRTRMVGNPFERDGEKTTWLKSLLIWGHDPRLPLQKVV